MGKTKEFYLGDIAQEFNDMERERIMEEERDLTNWKRELNESTDKSDNPKGIADKVKYNLSDCVCKYDLNKRCINIYCIYDNDLVCEGCLPVDAEELLHQLGYIVENQKVVIVRTEFDPMLSDAKETISYYDIYIFLEEIDSGDLLGYVANNAEKIIIKK